MKKKCTLSNIFKKHFKGRFFLKTEEFDNFCQMNIKKLKAEWNKVKVSIFFYRTVITEFTRKPLWGMEISSEAKYFICKAWTKRIMVKYDQTP